MERIARDTPPAPRRFEPGIPRDLETIVLKAMARDPADRYRSATEMAEDLHRFQSDRPIRARRASPVEELWRWGRRNRLVAGLAASIAMLLVVFAVGASLAAFRMGRDRDQARKAERERTGQLARSLLDQARAARFSRRPGQRFEGLDAIRRASLLARQLGEPASFIGDLRIQAIACRRCRMSVSGPVMLLPARCHPASRPRRRTATSRTTARARFAFCGWTMTARSPALRPIRARPPCGSAATAR